MYSGGSGTELDPYLISTVQDLIDVASNQNKYFKQINDISLVSIANWTPFTNFTGVYDGDKHEITDYVSTKGGLFATVTNGTIKNVTIEGSTTAQYIWVDKLGGLINESISATLDNISCKVLVSFPTRGTVGGLAGSISAGASTTIVKNCTHIGNVTGAKYAGGFAGVIYANTNNENVKYIIQNCYSIGNITSGTNTGGFVGEFALGSYYPVLDPNRQFTDCYSVGVVNSVETSSGGFCGSTINVYAQNCHDNYYDSTVSGRSDTKCATPKTTAEMKTQGTFTNWDFTTIPVWVMDTVNNSGYPNLKWYYDTLVQLPNLKVNIGGSLGTYVDGWVNIDGVACRVDKIWIRVADALKLI